MNTVIARVSNASGYYIDVTETFEVLTLTDPGDIRFSVGGFKYLLR